MIKVTTVLHIHQNISVTKILHVDWSIAQDGRRWRWKDEDWGLGLPGGELAGMEKSEVPERGENDRWNTGERRGRSEEERHVAVFPSRKWDNSKMWDL